MSNFSRFQVEITNRYFSEQMTSASVYDVIVGICRRVCDRRRPEVKEVLKSKLSNSARLEIIGGYLFLDRGYKLASFHWKNMKL